MIELKKENNPSRETKNYLAEQVFELVFYIGKKGIEFTEEERKVIGPLIKRNNLVSLHLYFVYWVDIRS